MSNKFMYLPTKCSKILHFLFQNRIASAKIIHAHLFPDNHIRGINKHLKRLVDIEYIERRFISNENLRSLTVYSLTKKGFKYGLPDLQDVKNAEIKSGKIQHDLMALKIRHRLSKLLRVEQVWSENQIHYENEYFEKDHFRELARVRADGAFSFKYKGRKTYVSIEYEASIKTKARNKSKIGTYVYMRNVPVTLYICKNKYIKNSLEKVEREYIKNSTRKSSNIYYGLLGQVLDESESPVFTSVSGREFLSLSEEKKMYQTSSNESELRTD